MVLFFSLLFFHFSLVAQQHGIDSLRMVLKSQKNNDTGKVNTLNAISFSLKDSSKYDSALIYSTQAQVIAEKLGYKKGVANALRNAAIVYDEGQSNYTKALEYYKQSFMMYQEIGDKKDVARNIGDMGSVYWTLGNYPIALEYHLKALSIDQEIGYKLGIASDYTNISNTYGDQGNNDKGLEYAFKALAIFQDIKDKDGIATIYCNIGTIYDVMHDYTKAIEYSFKALPIYRDMRSKDGVAIILGNIGNVYDEMATVLKSKHPAAWSDSLYKKALEYGIKALAIEHQIGDKRLIAYSYNYLASAYLHEKNYSMPKKYYDSAYTLAKKMGDKEIIRDTYQGRAALDSTMNNLPAELNDYKKYIVYRDSLINEANTKKSVQAEMNYEFQQKQATQKAEQDKRDAMAEQERKKQAVIRNSLLAGFTLVLALVFFILRGFRQKRKAYVIISQQKEEVDKSRKKIMDSIKYAQKIQYSILPSGEEIKHYLSDYFVCFLPKDIVSGDFYWFHHIEGLSYLAAIDCTGHGVPGACMSMLAHSFLNEIVVEKKVSEPAEILAHMHQLVFSTLHQQKGDEYSQDGMDISLIVIDHEHNRATFSGAKNNALLVDGQNIRVLKATPKSMGGVSMTGDIEPARQFKSETVELNKGNLLVMATDGMVDQLNANDEKFGKTRFNEMVKSLYTIPMEKGETVIETAIHKWKSTLPQQDDILVMGMKV